MRGTHVNREGQILRAYVESLNGRAYRSSLWFWNTVKCAYREPVPVNWRELADHVCARGQNISSKRIISCATVERYILNEPRDSLTTQRYPIILLATFIKYELLQIIFQGLRHFLIYFSREIEFIRGDSAFYIINRGNDKTSRLASLYLRFAPLSSGGQSAWEITRVA